LRATGAKAPPERANGIRIAGAAGWHATCSSGDAMTAAPLFAPVLPPGTSPAHPPHGLLASGTLTCHGDGTLARTSIAPTTPPPRPGRRSASTADHDLRQPAGARSAHRQRVCADRGGGRVHTASAGRGGAGTIAPMPLEGANVDLAEEFTKMIVAQRACSASARVITTTDEMLDELTRISR
jgi:hypothetical protein